MITRRHFLTAVALSVPVFADESAPAIIDAHFHVWDPNRLLMPWLGSAGPLLNRVYAPADYQQAIAGLNVRGSVYVEVAVDPHLRDEEVLSAVQLCNQKSPAVLGAVAGGNPTDPEFAGYVDRLQTHAAVRGMRVTLPSEPAKNATVVKGLRRLGRLQLAVDLNASGSQLLAMVDLIKVCNETSFIIDHCGNASPNWFESDAHQTEIDQWKSTIEHLAARPNAACKISGVAENGAPAKVESINTVVKHCLDAFGIDRVLFATNWPVCLKATTPAKWFAIVDRLTRRFTRSDREKLFALNAERWYRLR
jgi:L-fuconolactonase